MRLFRLYDDKRADASGQASAEGWASAKAEACFDGQAGFYADFYGARNRAAARAIRLWLISICGLIAVMVTIGGATRLTDSGLSITEWDLILGALPPWSDAAWLVEFEKYKQIPEYSRVNQGMTLAQFKVIYWWEWGHRNLGRAIGLAFLIPYLIFLAKRQIATRRLALQLAGLFLLICAQGAMGWYMVTSGLTERVDVSQYRLAAHLGLAMVLFAACLWIALQLRRLPDRTEDPIGEPPASALCSSHSSFPLPSQLSASTAPSAFAQSPLYSKGLRRWTTLLLLLIFCQIILGAFVAGLRAGQVYTSWPLMEGAFFPAGYFSDPPRFTDPFENIPAVQFNHRLMAYILLLISGLFALYTRRLPLPDRAVWHSRAAMLLAAILLQAGLGIWTLVTATPIALALTHQLGALSLLGFAVFNLHTAYTRP